MITSRSPRRAGSRAAAPERRPRAPAGRVAAAAAALAVAAGGCAAVPTSGAVQQIGVAGQVGSGQEQDYSQPIPVGPGPGWSPEHIVAGFLAASASFANDHGVAREYLDSTAQATWHPGWAVTVESSMKTSPVQNYPRDFAASQSGGYTKVVVTGVRVTTLTATGQSQISPGSPRPPFTFSLIKVSGQWRIDNLPTSQLLLTQADFQRVYQPRDLYFLGRGGQTLVPDPVFVPAQDTNTELATGLVTALLQEPRGWLDGAVTTGFPKGTILIGQVRINGPNATVDLGGKAAAADRWRQEQMAAQLAWTLASGPTAIQSVELEINGRPLQIAGNQLQLLQAYQGWMPAQSAPSSLYFIGSSGSVSNLSGAGGPGPGPQGRVTAVSGPAGASGVPALSSIAVSPDGRSIAGISASGTSVYTGSFSRNGSLRTWHSPSGACTSLSWDPQGDLWITAGGSVWMLPPGGSSAVQVSSPGDQVTAFRVAPDGIRAVMIVNGTQIQLAAITHSGPSASIGQGVTIGNGVTDPVALTWYDADEVIALARTSSGSQLEEVPLNGGQPTPIAAQGSIVSVTATSPGGSNSEIAVGLSGGQIMVSTNMGAFENTRATGQAPAYPG
jgi:hypothetical protein